MDILDQIDTTAIFFRTIGKRSTDTRPMCRVCGERFDTLLAKEIHEEDCYDE